jgi:hypothetical protein
MFLTEEIGCTVSPIGSIKCAFVLNVLCKGSWRTVDLCSAQPVWNHVEQILTPPHPSIQAMHPPLP